MAKGNFFKGRVNPSKWRPVRKGEAGYGSRQYVRKSVKTVTEKTQRLSVSRYQTAKFGATPAQRARMNVSGRTPEQIAATKAKREATAKAKREYGGRVSKVKIKEIRELNKITTKKQAKALSEADRRRLGYLAAQDPKKHADFLNWIGSPVKKKQPQRRGTRLADEMRRADQRRRKASTRNRSTSLRPPSGPPPERVRGRYEGLSPFRLRRTG